MRRGAQRYTDAYDAAMSRGVARNPIPVAELRAERAMIRAFLPGFPTFSERPRSKYGMRIEAGRLAAVAHRNLPIEVIANLAGCGVDRVRRARREPRP